MQAKTVLRQKAFREHVIRSEEDYQQIRDYADNDPARWAEDIYFIPDRRKRGKTPEGGQGRKSAGRQRASRRFLCAFSR